MNFNEFNLDQTLIEGLSSMGFTNPTPVQEQAIPYILANKDLIACAQTGTGKTAAYLLPIINKIVKSGHESINTIIIAPTRELAVQIDQQLEGLAYFTSISSLAVYGGTDGASFDRQKSALQKGADIIIATPGKFISHLNLGYVNVKKLQHLILDEADRMLDMGFYDDIMKIISYLPKKRQTLLFSATMPPKIRTLAQNILVDPEQINIALSKPAEGVFQAAFLVYDQQKVELIKHLLAAKSIPSVIIFCSRKSTVKTIESTLKSMNFSAKAIHSDLEQLERESVLRQFKNRQIQILVATDIVARGIDVEAIGLVINFDVPQDAEDYIHRVGRTARAESTGVAFTFVNEADQQNLYKIEQLIGTEIKKVKLPAQLGEGPAYQPLVRKRNPEDRRQNKKRRSGSNSERRKKS
ncbi:DEAD/DEAH box helicase [soil metagenome]